MSLLVSNCERTLGAGHVIVVAPLREPALTLSNRRVHPPYLAGGLR